MEITLEQFGSGIILYKTPLKKPPPEIIKLGKDAIKNYFNANKRELNEIKTILIGEPKAGKTSLLNRLKNNEYDEKEEQTDGINIESIEFGKNKHFETQNKLHKLTGHFWDFGGQEIMNATHQFFLTNRSVYVLVLDARTDTDTSSLIRKWVKRIKASGKNSPIIIVANKIDINPGFGFENETELKVEFPEIKSMISTSCSACTNIDLLKNELEKIIPQAELFHTEIDERWIDIKEKLQTETKENSFLNETRFKEICVESKLKDEKEQKQCIKFLHDLGLVLHFEDIAKELGEYYVLDPYWITYGVYQILTSKKAATQKGKVNINNDLKYIINLEKDKEKIYKPVDYKKITYSTNQRRFLVDILNQFRLCFYQSNKEEFIIPDLLDTKEPSNKTGDFRNPSDNVIKFVYEYDYLPKTIMPQIIVETHNMLCDMWRTGCILKYDNSKALISTYSNRIYIFALGDNRKRRELLIIIRSLIDSINTKSSYKATKLVPLPNLDNEFADYQVLLNREKKGKDYYYFDEDLETEKCYLIHDLLEGIPSDKEITGKKLKELLELVSKDVKDIKGGVKEINIKLDDIVFEFKEISETNQSTVIKELTNFMSIAFETNIEVLNDDIQEKFEEFKKKDNFELKIKASVPLLKELTGINIEAEFDIKNWTEEMYNKHKLNIYKLFGYV
ncbi:MAG: GTP-binding protein [Arcobacter sp.]|nr:GTP-binding protein [Arcobacter sp.]